MSSNNINAQLNRIKGQIGGVIKMYDQEKPCIEIVRQIAAARNSLSSVARSMLLSEGSRCCKQNNMEEIEQILVELFKN